MSPFFPYITGLYTDVALLERISILLSEADRKMEKETIIFFDKLGFGWVVDNMMIKEMKLNHFKENYTINNSLMRILENIFNNPSI
jgi:hypothetical protein